LEPGPPTIVDPRIGLYYAHHKAPALVTVGPACNHWPTRGGAIRLAHDYTQPLPNHGHCRVRVYLPDEERDAPVVVCTEPEDNHGVSIHNVAEEIAAQVISDNHLPVPVVWIEHYERGSRGSTEELQTFELVLFSSYEIESSRGYAGEERKRIGRPVWKPLDRVAVEAIVGQPISESPT
jgi:hypothetical protein